MGVAIASRPAVVGLPKCHIEVGDAVVNLVFTRKWISASFTCTLNCAPSFCAKFSAIPSGSKQFQMISKQIPSGLPSGFQTLSNGSIGMFNHTEQQATDWHRMIRTPDSGVCDRCFGSKLESQSSLKVSKASKRSVVLLRSNRKRSEFTEA